jgi:hypothetical protein
MDEDYQVFREPRGEVELAITWAYDPEASSKSGFFPGARSRKRRCGIIEPWIADLLHGVSFGWCDAAVAVAVTVAVARFPSWSRR